MAKTFSELQALALQIRDEILEKKNTAPRVGAALLDMIDNTIQNITDINQKLSVFEHACSGFKRVQTESQLPVTPPEDEKAVGYLVGTNLYLYVGKDGNAVNGRYFNVGDITGPQGEPGPQGLVGPVGPKGDQGNSGVTGPNENIEVVNNLDGGESSPERIKVLAAEQGKVLNNKIVELEYEALSPYDITDSKVEKSINNWIGIDGAPISIMPSARVYGILVKPNTKYRIKMSVPTEIASSKPRKGYAFYSSDSISSDSFISGSDDYTGGDNVINEDIITPSNCIMIGFSGYTDKENFSLYRQYSVSEEDYENTKQNVHLNTENISTLDKNMSELLGFENKPIDLEWTKGYTNLQGEYVNDNMAGFVSTVSVILDNYDELNFTLTNVNSILSASNGTSLLLSKANEEPIKLDYTTTKITCANYKGYTVHFNQKHKDTTLPIIYITKKSKIPIVDKELSGNSDNAISNSVVTKKIEEIFGFNERPLELEWTKGYVDLSGNFNSGYGTWIKTTSVFLDDYDKITFSLADVNKILGGTMGTSLLLTKDGEQPLRISYNTPSLLCANYKGYTAHFNQIYNTTAGEPQELPIISATKFSITAENKEMADEIVCDGDSLTNNYPAELQKYAVGYIVRKCQMGGETSIANLCRMGGLQFVNTSPITIPASGVTAPFPIAGRWITSEHTYAKLSFANLSEASTTLNGAIVKGIKGTFSKVTSQAKGLVIYNSSDIVVKTFDTLADVVLSTLLDVSYCRITINNPFTNEPHLSLDDEPQNVASLCTQNGFIGSDGNFVFDESFKCSDKIILTGKNKIYADGLATSEGYVFTREKEGEDIKLGSNNIFTAGNYEKYKNCIHIVFTGQNGGYDNEEDLVAQIKTATAHLSRFIVVSTWSTRTTEKLNKLMIAAFGNRYINLREYMINQSVLDAIKLGLIEENSNVNDWQSLFIADGIHPNTNGNILWAILFWNTLLDLELVKGERIEKV